jgi:hypothetical protein
VRIWGNYIDQSGTGIASLPNAIGPLYMFRNVYNRSRMLEKVPLDSDDRQVMFKAGSDATFGDGRRYIFHNTTLQATQAGVTYGLGASGGISGNGSTRLVKNTVSRNNIFHNWRTWSAYFDIGTGNDFGWDMFNGSAGAAVTNPIMATPTYASRQRLAERVGRPVPARARHAGLRSRRAHRELQRRVRGRRARRRRARAGHRPMRFGIAASPDPPRDPRCRRWARTWRSRNRLPRIRPPAARTWSSPSPRPTMARSPRAA